MSAAAPSPAAEHGAAQRARGRRMMLFVFAVCAAPIVLGTLAYFFFPPSGRVNYGELLPISQPRIAATRLDGRPFEFEQFGGKWTLVLVDSPRCDERCQKKLHATRQVRTAQGREQDRVERLWLLHGDGPVDRALDPLIAGATLARIAIEDDPARAFGAAPSEHLYLVDPMGNLMMRFPAEPEPRRFIKDLQKLLRVNQRAN